MADTVDAQPVFMKDKNKNYILPAADWSAIQNKPNNLVTADQLPVPGPWIRTGLTFLNGAYPWGAASDTENQQTCHYRIVDFGSFKIVEMRLAFACTKDITTNDVTLINLPSNIRFDGDDQYYEYDANTRYLFNGVSVQASPLPGGSGKVPANTFMMFHTIYTTTV